MAQTVELLEWKNTIVKLLSKRFMSAGFRIPDILKESCDTILLEISGKGLKSFRINIFSLVVTPVGKHGRIQFQTQPTSISFTNIDSFAKVLEVLIEDEAKALKDSANLCIALENMLTRNI